MHCVAGCETDNRVERRVLLCASLLRAASPQGRASFTVNIEYSLLPALLSARIQ